MLLWWRFDYSSGTARDSSGNGYNGTVFGATRGVTGHIKDAFDFDGVNDYVISTASGLCSSLQNSSEYAISFWAKAPNGYASDHCALSIDIFAFNGLCIYPYQDGGKSGDQVEIWYNGTSVNASNTADETVWNNFIFNQVSSTDIEMYVNGTSAFTHSGDSLGALCLSVTVGAYAGGVSEEYDGSIDHVQIWDRSLTDDEIDWIQEY